MVGMAYDADRPGAAARCNRLTSSLLDSERRVELKVELVLARQANIDFALDISPFLELRCRGRGNRESANAERPRVTPLSAARGAQQRGRSMTWLRITLSRQKRERVLRRRVVICSLEAQCHHDTVTGLEHAVRQKDSLIRIAVA